MVGSKRGLIEAIVAEADFIDPTGTRDPGPVCPQHLRPGVNLGQPLRLQLARVRHSPGVVAEEIPPIKNVALGDVIVDFADRIVGADSVREPESNESRIYGVSSVIGRKSFAIAGNRGTQGTATDLQTDIADRDICRLQGGNGIYQAIRRVAPQRDRSRRR